MSDPVTDHLLDETISGLADGELSAGDLARTSQHLAVCAACTTRALQESLLQRATARAGQRYALPESFEARILQTIAARKDASAPSTPPVRAIAFGRSSVWAGALAALLLVTASGLVAHDLALRSAHTSALVTEVVDEHIAAMAVATPEVISTDRHTVKPWFQGKLPFSFNLPAALPADITLDGANLVQLSGQPTAQLIFSIGKHHASVFLRQRRELSLTDDSIHHTTERNGFHVEGFRTPELDGLAVSDADPARLHTLALAMQQAQAGE
jgi:anti-sigma factor RsiW